MEKQQHLLVFRFSSLGDVAMTVPVLRCLLLQHPHLTVTMVSNSFVAPLFAGIPRLHFHAADLKGKHKGVPGLFRLYRELSAAKHFDGIADLHNVLRTKIVRGFFFMSGKPMAAIDKGRSEKKELTRRKNKNLHPLKSTFQRYADVFKDLGFPIDLQTEMGRSTAAEPSLVRQYKQEGFRLIGIAPFALHAEKSYPPQQMLEVLRLLTADPRNRVFLFGGRQDHALLQTWSTSFPQAENMATRFSFAEELNFIAHLHLMVSMDSANMHLASLFGVPVVSIWGGTHPYLGFYGWGQDPANAVQLDMECRPSSVFGNKACYNEGACLKGIAPVWVYEKINQQLERSAL